MNSDDVLFPHEKVRDVQDKLIKDVFEAIKNKNNMVIHAPTGIGKTVSVLAPALSYAIKNEKTIFFLTSRHTQHMIAIDTLKKIKKKFPDKFTVADIIGRKWMCLQPAVHALHSSEFTVYCKKLREDNQCEFYSRIREKGKLSVRAKKVLDDIKTSGPHSSEELTEVCKDNKLCPYEISTLLCKNASVIIGDYYHIFSDNIRKTLFQKADLSLSDSIVIVDEGHNLPARIRNFSTIKLSNMALDRAIKESKKLGYNETVENLKKIKKVLVELSKGLNINDDEKLVKKSKFIGLIEEHIDYDQLANDLIFIGDEIREKQRQSYTGSIGDFLEVWQGIDEGFTRILSKKESKFGDMINLSYICLDPSLITRDTILDSHSTILMSGTLTPTSMYKDLLGFDDAIEKTYPNPFPEKNKLSLIIPDTTTKFTRRSEEEFKKIAKYCADITNIVPGNSLLFFPSYALRDKIYRYYYDINEKTVFLEKPDLSKDEKSDMIKNFGSYKRSGAVFLAVASGSFGEGIDLPGDLLKAVIVVGLPLERPSLEIKELIAYYEKKFGKGWDYGYIFPAIIKTLQNAGRCIRTEKDKGVIVFLDERFSWPNYIRCFPPDMDIKITKLYEDRIKGFFEKKD